MSGRVFLAAVGLAYVVLAVWCVTNPAGTSDSVGFTLKPGSGQSEYMVVYGGLQIGLAAVFLIPAFHGGNVPQSLAACALVHGSIVAFRAASFATYTGMGTTTYVLAVLEWVIFLVGAALWWRSQPSSGVATPTEQSG
jgi:hypothetical protein